MVVLVYNYYTLVNTQRFLPCNFNWVVEANGDSLYYYGDSDDEEGDDPIWFLLNERYTFTEIT